MEGIYFNFSTNDIEIRDDGTFKKAEIGSQNCTLIAMSQICRLTKPEVGEQLGTKLILAKNVNSSISAAKRAVEQDGGKDVEITFNEGNLSFKARYES